jgi:hypothetical protein
MGLPQNITMHHPETDLRTSKNGENFGKPR